MIGFMTNTPHHKNRAICFALFKELIWRFNEEARVQFLIQLLTDTSVASVQVAALSILKDNIHDAWNKNANVTNDGSASIMAVRRLQNPCK